MSRRHVSLLPRNTLTLIVLIVARISGCASQKELSLEDQVDHAKEEIAELYDGPVEFRVIATKGKGERLDRPELGEVEAMLRTREVDVLVMEDVGRLVRGTAAVDIWGVAVDHGTRCIAPNDCVDSSDETWEEDLITACAQHVGHNAHTSKRLKRKQMNRFRRRGEATGDPIFGVVKPEGAKSYDDWLLDQEAVPWILKGKYLLSKTRDCSAVADFFNKNNVPTGPCARTDEWTGRHVRRLYENPLLKGLARRGTYETVKHNETGRRVSVKNPDGPEYYEVPHLAILDADEIDELNAALTEKNAKSGRKETGGAFSRGPMTRTPFPAQHALCLYCGRLLVRGANGKKDGLMCNGSREYRCWNSIGVPCSLLAEKVVDVILRRLDGVVGFDEQWAELVRTTYDDRPDVDAERAVLRRERDRLAVERKNFMDAVGAVGPREDLLERLQNLDERGEALDRRERLLERRADEAPGLPDSLVDLRTEFDAMLHELAIDSWELGLHLRQLVPEIHTYNVRLCDESGHVLPRARVVVDLAAGMDLTANPDLESQLRGVETIDLFEPVQKVAIREEAASLSGQGLTQKQIAARIVGEPTATAVGHALRLEAVRLERGLDSVYEVLLEPPANYGKLRRHRHQRYEFEPLEGYVRPTV